MKICIVGAGAIGGLVGARLAAAGAAEVSALARGATLAALRARGWRLRDGDREWQLPARADDRAEALGPQELVVVAVKAPSLPALAGSLAPLMAPDTMVLPAMNGVPWWFADGVVPLAGIDLGRIDPGRRIAAAIPIGHVVGCVVHASASLLEPGYVRHAIGRGLIVGEPAGGSSARVDEVAATLAAAGFDVTRSPDIRRDIWYKLWGNMTINPISAITGATADRILADPLARAFCSAAMREAAAIGARIGCPIDQEPEDRHAITARLGRFKSSMLQDVEAGRPIELDALLGIVHDFGRHLGVATPSIDALLGLARLFATTHDLIPGIP